MVFKAWSTLAASSAFAASPALPSIKTKIASPLLSSGSSPPPPHRTVLSPPDAVGAALAAPTVEVFTGYGAEAGFEDNVRDFSAKVDAEKPTGYHAAAVGPVADPVAKGEAQGDADKGLAVKLVIGWDSKEAHLEAKGKSGGEFVPLYCHSRLFLSLARPLSILVFFLPQTLSPSLSSSFKGQ